MSATNKDSLRNRKDAPAMIYISTADEDSGEDVPHCWICHEEDTNELGETLRRDCSCRGDSGFAHLSCIVEYANHQTKHLNGRNFVK